MSWDTDILLKLWIQMSGFGIISLQVFTLLLTATCKLMHHSWTHFNGIYSVCSYSEGNLLEGSHVENHEEYVRIISDIISWNLNILLHTCSQLDLNQSANYQQHPLHRAELCMTYNAQFRNVHEYSEHSRYSSSILSGK